MSIRNRPWLAWAAVALFGAIASAADKDPPPIKVRPDEPFKPYDQLLPTDKVIEQTTAKLKANPKDLTALTSLAHLYIRRARDTGDYASYDLAEAAVNRALALNKDDLGAQVTMGVVLCAQHRFSAALKQAQELYRKNPNQHQILLTIGDVQLELGDNDAADKTYQDLKKKEPRAILHSRLARLAEVRGQHDEALRLMKLAEQEESHTSMTREGRAWWPFRLGEMHFNAGQLDKAAEQLEEALKFNPSYPLALAWLGRVRAAQGKYDEAIKHYVRAVAGNADLATLAELGDLYARTGKEFLAKLNYDKLELAGKKDAVYARELSLFYSDHDRNLADAVELAKKDLTVRKDAHAHDTLAWALCKNKQYKEAAEAIGEALKTGNKDASVLYHAGMIQLGLGDKDKARAYLKQALERNPHFSLLQAERARQALKDLGD